MIELRPTPLTVPASWLFRWGSALYHGGWDAGVFRPARLPGRVLSVGNLTVGGSGKTPTVLALARAARARGRHPALLTRGYGGGHSGVLRGGQWSPGHPARAADTGDEALWLSREIPEVPVVVGVHRAAGALALLAGGEQVDLWILDDGFQHRRVHRTGDLVLLDGHRPLGNGRLLPAGPLREPARALRRATAILLTGLGPGDEIPPDTAALLREHGGDRPVWRSWVEPEGASWLGPGPTVPVPDLVGHPVLAVAGIARPERFLSVLREVGCQVVAPRCFPDHHPFSRDEIRDLEREARERGAVLITTAKDAVRLEDRVSGGSPWLVFRVRSAAEPGWETMVELLTDAGSGDLVLAPPLG